MSEPTAPILDVRDLRVEFPIAGGTIAPVRGVSFTLAPRQRLGIVGESGSGKSLTALSLMRLLPSPGRIGAGEVLLGGQDLARLSESEMARVRGGSPTAARAWFTAEWRSSRESTSVPSRSNTVSRATVTPRRGS